MLSCVLLTKAFKVKYNLVNAFKTENLPFLLLFPSLPSILHNYFFMTMTGLAVTKLPSLKIL